MHVSKIGWHTGIYTAVTRFILAEHKEAQYWNCYGPLYVSFLRKLARIGLISRSKNIFWIASKSYIAIPSQSNFMVLRGPQKHELCLSA